MLITKIHNVETGEIIEREMNVEELAQYEALIESISNRKAKDAEDAAKRQALLAKLGITEEEAKLLLA